MSSLLQLSNNAIGRLSGNVLAGDLSLSLQPGEGALFPTISGSQYFPVSIIRASDGAIEIVKVTARSSDTLTIERAQESTTALAFVAGDRVEGRMTAKTFMDQETATATHAATSKTTPVDADEIPLVDSADSNLLKKLTWANLKAGVFSAWGALINGGTSKATPVDADALALMDSEGANATKKLTWANAKATLKAYFDTTYPAIANAATKAGIQAQTYTFFTTEGTSTAYTLTPSPALSELAEGQEFDIEFHTAAGATPTLAISGQTAKSLKYRNSSGALSAITSTQVPSGWRSKVVYDGTDYIVREVPGSVITLGVPQATTSGTSKDFTDIPAGTKRVTINFAGVSTNNTSAFLLQIGDAGGIENTGYNGGGFDGSSAPAIAAYTTGFGVGTLQTAARSYSGTLTLTLQSSATNTWCCSGSLGRDTDGVIIFSAGSKSLSAELDRVRVTTAAGTATFDAGSINITYE